MYALLFALAWVSVTGPMKSKRPTPREGQVVNLSLRPSRVAQEPALDVRPPTPEPPPKGAYMGPIYLDGIYAKSIAKIPAQVRRGMGRAVGPEPMVFDKSGRGVGAGVGLYARF